MTTVFPACDAQNVVFIFETDHWYYALFKVSSILKHPPRALIGASAFAFNKYPHKLYIFWKLKSSRLLLIPI